jgi:hypothetical protein
MLAVVRMGRDLMLDASCEPGVILVADFYLKHTANSEGVGSLSYTT